jgi:Cu(I)/Ag(I) efflux system membrane fusion protein
MFANGKVTAKLPIEEAHLTVPKSAVMWTGKRSVVYTAIPNAERPMFEFREVTLGLDLGGYFIVESGLKSVEVVVTNGTFKVDAAAQLAGKKSMMNKTGTEIDMEHRHDNTNLESTPRREGLSETSFTVSGNCDMCKARIEEAAQLTEGVAHAVWNKESKHLTVHFDEQKTSKELIAKAIAKAGHDTEIEDAPKGTYGKLPACCQYTRDED